MKFVRMESGDVDDQPYWQQRGWLLSAAFVTVLFCVGGVFAVAASWGDDGERRAAPAAVIGAAKQDGARPDGCRTDDTDRSIPVRPPADITWRPLNGAKVPLSASAGPLKTSGPLMWCFAHTPMGAVMAAHVIPRHMSGPDWREVAEQQLMPGAGREVFVAMRSSLPDEPAASSETSLAGFSMVSYQLDKATVRLLLKQGKLYAATDYTVAWDGADWKVQPMSSGDLHTPLALVGTGGFVMWEA
ncbi:hypothetical protein [Jidongwangia harbinensis]|uniref:hypothetical protein n=1 Tax=Jidongwangia harbinensis TaxID=2878561 RepID=UPI001CD9D406|nr:hypothetical protein [Jidongwangia harbinensis]MCA2211838.1 hypothetical protein [Jidongwangia harbinensis]